MCNSVASHRIVNNYARLLSKVVIHSLGALCMFQWLCKYSKIIRISVMIVQLKDAIKHINKICDSKPSQAALRDSLCGKESIRWVLLIYLTASFAQNVATSYRSIRWLYNDCFQCQFLWFLGFQRLQLSYNRHPTFKMVRNAATQELCCQDFCPNSSGRILPGMPTYCVVMLVGIRRSAF